MKPSKNPPPPPIGPGSTYIHEHRRRNFEKRPGYTAWNRSRVEGARLSATVAHEWHETLSRALSAHVRHIESLLTERHTTLAVGPRARTILSEMAEQAEIPNWR